MHGLSNSSVKLEPQHARFALTPRVSLRKHRAGAIREIDVTDEVLRDVLT